jgi:hypothetical protein
MKIKHLWAILTFALISACSPILQPTPLAPTPSPTTAVDELAPFREALISSNQQDLDQLDHPTRYNLKLTYDPKTPTLAGTEDVRYFNRQSTPLAEVYFRLFANYPGSGGKIEITALKLDGAPVASVLEAQDTALKITLPKPLAPGSSANIHLEFSVTIPRNTKGHYSDFAASDPVVTMPTVYPLIPAYDAKGWHIEVPPPYGDLVYADVSLYAVTLTVPSKMSVIASGSTVGTKDNGDGTNTWSLVGAPMRDFDINLSDQLQKSSTVVGDTTVNSWYEAADTQSGKDALKYAADAFTDFEKRFGPYPYRELDVVETPTTAGGIEYPGLVVIAHELYGGQNQRSFFEFATVHEVSHQWWYGLVGDDQANTPWVDESLAQYSTLIYMEDLKGKASGQTVLRDYFQSLYNQAKSAGHDAAVNQPVSAFNESDYSSIVYGKGPLFYDAIRRKMGDDKFFKFLRTYMQQYEYKVATPDDILKTAEGACNCSLQDEYKQWILSPAK